MLWGHPVGMGGWLAGILKGGMVPCDFSFGNQPYVSTMHWMVQTYWLLNFGAAVKDHGWYWLQYKDRWYKIT